MAIFSCFSNVNGGETFAPEFSRDSRRQCLRRVPKHRLVRRDMGLRSLGCGVWTPLAQSWALGGRRNKSHFFQKLLVETSEHTVLCLGLTHLAILGGKLWIHY